MADQQIQNMLLHARRMLKNDPSSAHWAKMVADLEFQVYGAAHPVADEHKDEVPVPDLPPDFSPAEVQNAEGYEQLELPPVNLPHHRGTLKEFFSGPMEEGLKVSKRRYYGCHLLQNRQESAKLWIERSNEVAEHYGVTPRLIAMAGYAMLDQWVMLPTAEISVQLRGQEKPLPYLAEPFVPYNETEQEVWKKCFEKYHFVGVYATANRIHGGAVITPDGTMIPRTLVACVTNHPQWVLYGLNQMFETAHYKARAFRVALNTAHEIDRNARLPVKGYERKRAIIDWKDEPTAVASTPEFVAGPDI